MHMQTVPTPREKSTIDRLMRLPEVCAATASSKPTIYRVIAQGKFLQPVKIGRMSAWPESEVTAFIESRKSARNLN